MSTDNREIGMRGEAGRIRRILAGGGQDPEVPEAELWSYALGILDPEERDQVMRLVAQSEAAQAELGHIREAIVAQTRRREAPAISTAGAVFHQAMAQLKQELKTLATALVRVRGGLVIVFCDPRWQQEGLQAVTLGEEAAETKESVPVKRVALCGPSGMRISAVHLPDGCVDVDVKIPNAPEGWVKVYRLVPAAAGGLDQEFTGIQGRLKEGQAHLSDCPDGFLRLAGPGDLAVDVYLGCAAVGI